MPPGRVLALMSAGDGGIVADLRGLHAWLAVHCLSARTGLIERDPLGIVLYGDLRGFSTNDKKRLLEALGREAKRYPWFRSRDWNAPPFGALADQGMCADFREILAANARDEAHESLLDCVLEAVSHGEPLPELGDTLLAVVRDPSHWPVNRKHAIAAYIRASGGLPGPLLMLLEDVAAGRVADGDDELMGLLLRQLYPVNLPPARVVAYLHPTKAPDLIGNYVWFWEHDLTENTATADLPILLDKVAQDIARLRAALDRFHFSRFAGHLLKRGIEAAGATVAVERLWHWLGIGLDEHGHRRLDSQHSQQIAGWLASRPDIYQALMHYAIHHCNEQGDVHCMFRAEVRLYGAEPLPGTEDWYFAQAQLASGENLRRHLFNKGAFTLLRRKGTTPEFVEMLNRIAERYPTLQSHVQGWLVSEWEEWRRDDAQSNAEQKEEDATRIEQWRQHFRDHHAAIESGTAAPAIMHELAMIYFGRYREAAGDTPIARFQAFFGGDAGITLAALAGLRRALARQDLPSIAEVVDLHVKGHHHLIAEAGLAGAQELARDGTEVVLALPRELQERLVAFRLTHDYRSTPSWFLALVEHRPETVADVLIHYAKAMFKARKENASGIYALAYEDAYAAVAHRAALPLLSAYPLRWKRESLNQLGTLLIAAIKHSDHEKLRHLIETKLSRPSLDAAQRSHWLAAGLLLDPVRYEQPLDRYVGASQSRAFLVAGFFGSRSDWAKGFPN
ncbi:MAG: hypothetical protein IPK39_21185 [Sulfuritalea sp.]|nr:hypothetical protein [Sulfuritalea sp.]